jgi:DNA repair exonuclease SbcCD nuclease subunit
MAKILFYSDPHFGLSRRENYTEKSLRAREEALFEYIYLLHATQNCYTVCLGDVFDKPFNPERTILAVSHALRQTDCILAGNHDVLNKDDSVSSLHLLAEMLPEQVILEPKSIPLVGVTLWFVPHRKTQIEFDLELETLLERANLEKGVDHILCLHCNYDSNFANTEQELNLTADLARDLLLRFKFILIGHEHAAAEHFGGRLKIVSSIFPTSFGDVGADHRALVYEKGMFIDIPTPVNAFGGRASDAVNLDPKQGYFELLDDLPLGETSRLAVDLFDRGAFAVKIRSGDLVEDVRVERGPTRSLPEIVDAFLAEQDEDLQVLWKEFLETARANS